MKSKIAISYHIIVSVNLSKYGANILVINYRYQNADIFEYVRGIFSYFLFKFNNGFLAGPHSKSLLTRLNSSFNAVPHSLKRFVSFNCVA